MRPLFKLLIWFIYPDFIWEETRVWMEGYFEPPSVLNNKWRWVMPYWYLRIYIYSKYDYPEMGFIADDCSRWKVFKMFIKSRQQELKNKPC